MTARSVIFVALALVAVVAPARGAAPFGEAAADSASGLGTPALPDTIGRPAVPAVALVEIPNDVRGTTTADPLARWGSVTGARVVGSGWSGHAASLARGALPATLSDVRLWGRPAADRLTGGLDPLTSYETPGGTRIAATGVDLTAWPVSAADAAVVVTAGGDAAGHGVGETVLLSPRGPLGERPEAVLTLGRGRFGRQHVAAEFGRQCCERRAGFSGLYEERSGRAPIPGGAYSIESSGGRLAAAIRGGWVVEFAALRADVTRALPLAALGAAFVDTRLVRSDADLRATRGGTRLQAYRTETWLEGSGLEDEGAVRSSRDGLAADLPIGAVWARSVAVRLERFSTSGGLLVGGQTAVAVAGALTHAFDLGGWRGSAAEGIERSRGKLVPSVRFFLSRRREGGTSWFGLEIGGRSPTALETALRNVEVPGGAGVGGNPDLDPELAAVASAGWSGRAAGLSLGCRAEAARVLDAIVLEEGSDGVTRPGNAADETVASGSLWGEWAGPWSTGARGSAGVFLLDPDGALNSLAPVPTHTVTASVFHERSFFRRDYVRTTWAASLSHRAGAARGPWVGDVDDATTSLALTLTGAADAARFFVSLENVLNHDHELLPGLSSGGRTLSAGFSWSFLD